MGRFVGKQENQPVRAGSKRASLSGSAGDGRDALRQPGAISISGRGRLRIAVSSFAAGAAEKNENLAFSLGHEMAAALGRFRRFDVIAAMSPNPAAPICLIREHQFRRMDLDYLVDLTVSENGQGSEINVRLLDLRGNARPIWSKRLDPTNCGAREIDELVATQIVDRIDPTVTFIEGELKLRDRHGTAGFLRRALPLMFSSEREKFQQAGQLIRLALQIDPDDGEIAAWAARWQYFNITLGYCPHSQQEFVKARDLALRAMQLNPDNAQALGLYAHYCAFVEKEFDTALRYFDRALHLNPSSAFIWGLSGPTYCYIGEPRTALQRLDHYRELAPFDPYMASFDFLYMIAYLFNEDYERAAMVGQAGVGVFPNFVNGYKPLIAALGHLGRRDEAGLYLDKLLTLEPGFTIERFAEVYPIKKAADRRRYTDGLRVAGVAVR
jgi:tetratricopeptide (TPR) repeat protein